MMQIIQNIIKKGPVKILTKTLIGKRGVRMVKTDMLHSESFRDPYLENLENRLKNVKDIYSDQELLQLVYNEMKNTKSPIIRDYLLKVLYLGPYP